MNPAPIDEVVDLLRVLRLPHMRAAAPELLATAKAQRWEPAEAIRALLTEELAGRQASSVRARRKAAGFPTGKTFDASDETVSSIPAPTQRALRTLEWLHRHENLVVCGPSGTPKTHFLEALGQAAVDAGWRGYFTTAEDMCTNLVAAKIDGTWSTKLRTYTAPTILVIDDVGLLPMPDRSASSVFFQVVNTRYQRGHPTIVTTNRGLPSGFDELMPKTIANATVDRLLHHAHIVLTTGDSIRLTQATAGKGVTPLTN